MADSIYRLHVTVLDPQGQPVEGGEVYSSVGGELQKVDGGWEIEIPAAKRPTDGRIEIRASERASFLEGSTEFEWVEGELQQAVTLRLEVPSDARVTGRVFDRDGNPVAGARVTSNRRPTSIEGGQHG